LHQGAVSTQNFDPLTERLTSPRRQRPRGEALAVVSPERANSVVSAHFALAQRPARLRDLPRVKWQEVAAGSACEGILIMPQNQLIAFDGIRGCVDVSKSRLQSARNEPMFTDRV
jgi:hypothetical protein